MINNQITLKEAVTFEGTGLHTGQHNKVTIHPAPENTGYIFKRVDLEETPTVKALADNVVSTSRGTTIQENNTRIATVEHVLAALYGLGIDNAVIEIDGEELPILDGSSKYYAESIVKTGTVEQDEPKDYYEIKEKISYKDENNGIELIAYPDEKFTINVLIDYNSRVIGNQYAKLADLYNFQKEIAACRTFVFFHELEHLYKHELIKGGDLENAIVIMENEVPQKELDRMADLFNKPRVKVKPNGILNNVDLHFANEPARHKLLDVIGDISLVGQPLKGRFYVTKPGHQANTEFAKKIISRIKKEKQKASIPKVDVNKAPAININQIQQILPHRPPFLLIDKIIELNENKVIGLKNVTMNEGFFVGHFPEEPIMPGVLQVEAMAQVGGILVLNTVPDPQNYLTYFLKIEQVKFKRKVVPGDTIILDLQLNEPIRRGIATMSGKGYVGENVVLEGEMMAQIVKVKKS